MTALCEECPPIPRPRFVVVDLDGTLLDRSDHLNPVDLSTLRALARTTPVAIATARPTIDAHRWATQVGARASVALGGAVILDGPFPVWTAPALSPAALKELDAVARTYRAELHLHTVDAWAPSADRPSTRAYARRHGLVARMRPFPPDTVIMAELVAAPGVLRNFRPVPALDGHTISTTEDPQGSYVVVSAPGADKRTALGRLLRSHAVEWDSVFALGDGSLDAPVLAAARTAVTLPHADPAARDAATHLLSIGPGCGSIHVAVSVLLNNATDGRDLVTCLHRKDSDR